MFIQATVAIFAVCFAAVAAPKPPALEGFDPVLLTEGKETPGVAQFTSEHGRFLYQFASAETKSRFDKDPDRYSIQLDGACARMGAPVGGNPDAYHVYQGKIYIFGSQECYRKFLEAPDKYLDDKAPAVWNPSPDSRRRAQALLAKARQAMGGEAAIGAIRSYIETRHSGTGEHASVTKIAVRFPDDWLSEVTAGNTSYGSQVSGTQAFNLFRGERTPIPPPFARLIRIDSHRSVLSLLTSQHLDAAEENGALVIHDDGERTTVELDSAGRIAAVAYRGRGPEGVPGTVRVQYSDYREVEGLWLPFKGTVSIDGNEWGNRGWAVDSYVLNPASKTV